MLKKINIFQKIDSAIFRLIDEIRNHQIYQLLIEKISLLPETTQKYLNYFITTSIISLPLLISLPFAVRMCSMNSEVKTQEKMIAIINDIIAQQNKFDTITTNSFSNVLLNNSKDFAGQLQEISTKANCPPGSVRVKSFEQDNGNSLFVHTKSTLQVENLTTEHLVNLLQEMSKKLRVRINGLQLSKDQKNMRIQGEIKLDHFAKKMRDTNDEK